MYCGKCSREVNTKPTKRGKERLPTGWHRWPETSLPTCPTCWGATFVVRAVTFPVDRVELPRTWKDFTEALKSAWGQTTALANYLVTEYAKADGPRMPADKKLGAMPRTYLYPDARERFPALPAQSVVAVDHAVQGKYRRKRLDVKWRSAAALPTFRYPTPFPMHNQSWSADYTDDGRPRVTVPLPGGRFALVLKAGREFRRQLLAFQQIVGGKVVTGEASLYRKRVGSLRGRGVTDRLPGGGNRTHYRIMCKLVAWRPKPAGKTRAGTLRFVMGGGSFIRLDGEGWAPINADHIRRAIIAHRRFLDRIAEDQKFEHRWPARERVRINDHRQRRCQTQANRLRTFIDQTTQSVAMFADYRLAATVSVDTSDRSFAPEFPWREWTDTLREKLVFLGIDFVASDEEMTDPEPESEDESLDAADGSVVNAST